MNNGDLISREAVIILTEEELQEIKEEAYDLGYQSCLNYRGLTWKEAEELQRYREATHAVDAVEVVQIKAYLQKKLDEWNDLGDRKFEPANMWGYNFIMGCFDDLEAYGGRKE